MTLVPDQRTMATVPPASPPALKRRPAPAGTRRGAVGDRPVGHGAVAGDERRLRPRDAAFVPLVILLISSVFGQRVALPFTGGSVPVALAVGYAVVAVLLLRGRLRIMAPRAALYWLTALSLTAVTLLFHPDSSIASLAYAVVCYFPYLLAIERDSDRLHLAVTRAFQTIMVIAAVAGVAQFAGQFVGGFWDISLILPELLSATGYNTTIPLEYGSDIYKSNGVFFLEPSFFSQFCALAIVLELLYFKRTRYLAVYLVGILCSLSGTGLILLAVFGPWAAVRSRFLSPRVAVAIVVVAGSAILFTPYAGYIAGRTAEFSRPGDSGHERFIAPITTIIDLADGSPRDFFVGVGAGTSPYPPITKVWTDYGMLSALLFLSFVACCYFYRSLGLLAAGALFFMNILLSGSLMQPQTVYLAYALAIVYSARRQDQPHSQRDRYIGAATASANARRARAED